MPNLKVMSWNLRTFGSNTLPNDIALIADIIRQSNADIVCIQEVQIGVGNRNRIGTPVSPAIIANLNSLHAALNGLTVGSTWSYRVTGANQGTNERGHMRDAYAYFWLNTPSGVASKTASFQSITNTFTDIVDISFNPNLRWPGRRPGVGVFHLWTSPMASLNLNIVSLHANTPPNGPLAAASIEYLSKLPGVGGSYPGAAAINYLPSPNTNTLVVGDFNYIVNGYYFPYHSLMNVSAPNLVNGYIMNIGNPGAPVLTTYSPVPANPPNLVSSYDNIFSLSNAPYTPAVNTVPVGAGIHIDFIAARINALMAVPGPGLPLYIAYKLLYKDQHTPDGASDHLPVCQDFQIN